MKALSKRLCTLLMLGSLAIPAQAATYLDVKLMDAVDQGQVAVVDSCLEKGADVNVQHGPKRETPLMKAIDRVATAGYKRESLGLVLLGLAALAHEGFLRDICNKKDFLSSSTSFKLNLLGGVSVVYGFSGLLTQDKLPKNILEIIKLLLKDPAMKIMLTDADTKTALARTQDHLAHLFQEHYKNQYKIKNLEEIEKLLIAKESEAKNEGQHEQAA